MNSPDSYSITYLTGAGMMVDLAAWILIGLGMLATSFSIGLLLAVARKRRIERNAAAELQMNWFARASEEHHHQLAQRAHELSGIPPQHYAKACVICGAAIDGSDGSRWCHACRVNPKLGFQLGVIPNVGENVS